MKAMQPSSGIVFSARKGKTSEDKVGTPIVIVPRNPF
jgi:hypothetical protein